MKPYPVFFISTIILLCISSASFGQCRNCPTSPIPVPSTDIDQFKKNYQLLFRQDIVDSPKHSVSVDFSKEAINEFYKNNFILKPGSYTGVHIFFTCINSNIYPGQKDPKQIGLMMLPSLTNCKPNSYGYSIINNSFDQDVNNNANTKYPVPADRSMYSNFTGSYISEYYNKDKDRHTKSVRFGISILKLFYELFEDATEGPKYKGLRIDFGTYNKEGVACGQKNPYQIALFLTPVKIDGSADYDALTNYFKMKYTGMTTTGSFNHGELCPNNCN